MNKKKFLQTIIADLIKEKNNLELKLKNRKEDVGSEDGPNQSRYVSLSRFALEEELVMMEKNLRKFKEVIDKLRHILNSNKIVIVKILISGKEKQLLLTENIEDFNHGIISTKSPIGQTLKKDPTKKLKIS